MLVVSAMGATTFQRGLTIHALSHPFGRLYDAYGLLNSIIMPCVVKANRRKIERTSSAAALSRHQGLQWLSSGYWHCARIGIPHSLAEIGIIPSVSTK
jgi:alcohol dehydrogenase class IV